MAKAKEMTPEKKRDKIGKEDSFVSFIDRVFIRFRDSDNFDDIAYSVCPSSNELIYIKRIITLNNNQRPISDNFKSIACNIDSFKGNKTNGVYKPLRNMIITVK